MQTVTVFSPAKLNLFLAITGRRDDGFHDLLSVVAPLELGDELTVSAGTAVAGPRFTLWCDDPAVPVDGSNLVLKAAQAFAKATGWSGRAAFNLVKRIPLGAGLGGGSSNGTAALRALNTLAGAPLGRERLADLAAELGSDCPLFLADGPVIVRGRGERVEAWPQGSARLAGRRMLVFKPSFSINTAWAYGRLAASAPDSYLLPAQAEARLAAWADAADSPVEDLLFNNMEPPAFAKFPALPVLADRLHERFGLAPRMSGSGSACFALLPEDARLDRIITAIRSAWGPVAFVTVTRIRG